jgi:hypothetical protein
MKLEKIKKTYCDYKLELSWGQVEAIAAALSQNHSDPLADELYAEWQWYMDHVPGPGEDEEEAEAQQKTAQMGGPEGAVEGEDLPIPMPPGHAAGTPPEGEGEDSDVPSEEEMSGAGEPSADVGLPEPEMADRGSGREETEPEMAVPEPPRE